MITQQRDSGNITLAQILFIILKRWKIIAITTIIGIILSYFYFYHIKKPLYKSHALIDPPLISGRQIISSASMETLLKNPLNPYLAKIGKHLNMSDKEAMGLIYAFEIKDKSNYLYLTTIASAPEKSIQLAEIIIQIILEYYNNISNKAIEISNSEIKNIKEQIAFIDKELAVINSKIEKNESNINNTPRASDALSAYLQYKENLNKHRSELYDKLFSKELVAAYSTKGAQVIAMPTIPVSPEESQQRNFIIASSAILVVGVLLALISELLSNS